MYLTHQDWMLLNAVAGDPERYRRGARLTSYYWGKQYDHLQHDWFTDAVDGRPIPLRSKRPKIIYALPKRMTQEVVELLVGTGRFPALRVDGDRTERADAATDTKASYSPSTEALGLLEQHTRLLAKAKGLARELGIQGSAALAIRTPAGQSSIVLDVFPGMHCTPTFGDDDPQLAERYGLAPDELVHLRVQYAFAREEREKGGALRKRWYVWRRDYTPDAVVDYAPAEIPTGPGGDVTAIPELRESGRWQHGLGVVPAEWFRTEDLPAEPDGPGIFEDVTPICDALNYRISQLDSSVEHTSDPTRVFRGMREDDWGVVQRQLMTGKGNSFSLPPGPPGSDPATVEFLELDGTSLERASEHVERLRGIALEVARVVIQRYEEGAGAQAGVALDKLFRPMLGLVQGLRSEIGPSLARFARKLLLVGDALRGTLDLGEDLPPFTPGLGVTVDWPPVFAPTPQDLLDHANAMTGMVAARVLSRETAAELTAALLDIDDVEQEKARLEAEAAADAEMVAAVGAESGEDDDDDAE